MDSIVSNLQELSQSIRLFSADRQAVTLIAVSKMQSTDRVAVAASAGHRDFGENYVQEGLAKIAVLKPQYPSLVWHMIGPIQSNKTRDVASHFDWVHTVDRFKIAQRLSDQRPDHLPDLNVLIQVNTDRENSKSGVFVEDTLALAKQIATLPKLRLRGLMCIPEKHSESAFEQMKHLLAQLHTHLPIFSTSTNTNTSADAPQNKADVLSMGMSADYVDAIAHGATHIRLGTAIFGQRVQQAASLSQSA